MPLVLDRKDKMSSNELRDLTNLAIKGAVEKICEKEAEEAGCAGCIMGIILGCILGWALCNMFC